MPLHFSRRGPAHRVLGFELLEDRQLLAITVNTLVDENNGPTSGTGRSLREALLVAQQGDTIDFAVTGIINLVLGPLTLPKSVTLQGPGANLLTIDARGNDPTPSQKLGDGTRVLVIDDGNNARLRNVAISGLIIMGGDYAQEGGGIYSRENLTVTDSIVYFNSSDDHGGGIYSETGSLHLKNSLLDSNYSRDYDTEGGGVYFLGTSIDIESSQISNNQALGITGTGGGIYVWKGSVSITDSDFLKNRAGGSGGGLAVLYDADSTPVTIHNSRFEENYGDDSAGGIFAAQPLVLTNSLINKNKSAGPGGGISAGRLDVYDSEISRNEGSGIGGGGIEVGTALTVHRTLFDGNRATGFQSNGGAILAWGATIDFVDSVAINNSASRGGAIHTSQPQVNVRRSTIAYNSASLGGGIASAGNLLVDQSAIFGNQGNGVFVESGHATILRSTLSANKAGSGGGIEVRNFGRLTVEQSTITGNSAYDGGGISERLARYSAEIRNTIIAGNFDTSGAAPDYERNNVPNTGAIRYSIIGDNVGAHLTEAAIGSPDLFGNRIGGPTYGVIDSKLGQLRDNGGPTWSHEVLVGSPAINSGDPAIVAGFDQRGAPWLRVMAGRADIGSFERSTNPLPGDYNFDGRIDSADYVVWRKLFGSQSQLQADGNGDLSVNQPDFEVWAAGFGMAWPAPLIGAGASLLEIQVPDLSTFVEGGDENVFTTYFLANTTEKVVKPAIGHRRAEWPMRAKDSSALIKHQFRAAIDRPELPTLGFDVRKWLCSARFESLRARDLDQIAEILVRQSDADQCVQIDDRIRDVIDRAFECLATIE